MFKRSLIIMEQEKPLKVPCENSTFSFKMVQRKVLASLSRSSICEITQMDFLGRKSFSFSRFVVPGSKSVPFYFKTLHTNLVTLSTLQHWILNWENLLFFLFPMSICTVFISKNAKINSRIGKVFSFIRILLISAAAVAAVCKMQEKCNHATIHSVLATATKKCRCNRRQVKLISFNKWD